MVKLIIATDMDKGRITVLLDNGHGKETPGKRSPDGRVLEWEYTRRLAAAIKDRLDEAGYNSVLLTPEDRDVSLGERCRRANRIAASVGSANCLLISLHINAAGNGSTWRHARGWQVCVSNNASKKSLMLAESLVDAAALSLKVRYPSNARKYWTQNLAICRDTYCPAVLTENLFMDSKDDCSLLLTAEGFMNLVDLHCKGIMEYVADL